MSNTNSFADFFFADLSLHNSGQRKYMTDKGDTHDYVRGYYNKEFTPIREAPINLLEIGLAYTGSAKLWRDWFINANIDIIEYDPNLIREVEGVNVYLADAYKQETLDMFPDNHYDYIIDDGPHTLESQIYAVDNWMSKLKIGGKLIVEDIASIYALEVLMERAQYPYQVFDLRHSVNRFDDIILEITRTQ